MMTVLLAWVLLTSTQARSDVVEETNRIRSQLETQLKAPAEDCKSAETTLEMGACLKSADERTSESLTKAKAEFLKSFPELAKPYDEFESSWMQYCADTAEYGSEKYEGGSFASVSGVSLQLLCKKGVHLALALMVSKEGLLGVKADAKKSDKKLNSEYGKLLKGYKERTSLVAKLKAAQRSWIKYRDASSALAARLWSKDKESKRLGENLTAKLTAIRASDLEVERKERDQM